MQFSRKMDLSNVKINTQSSIRIQGDKILYFDPYGIEDSPHDGDVIFITHEHQDHFDPPSIEKVRNEETILVAPQSMKEMVLAKSGLIEKKCLFYIPGTIHELGRLIIETVPAYNNRKSFHAKNKKWVGYIVEMNEVKYYIMGDTDVTDEAKRVRSDCIFIPIGGTYTMDMKQALDYILRLKPSCVVPTHYGSIVGKPEDGAEFKKLIEKKDKNIQVELKL